MIPGGHRFNFQARALPIANTDWRTLQHALARWVRAHGGDELLAGFAAQASLADAHGDSAVRIEDEPARDAIAASRLVGDAASGGTPFVLDGDLFYLRRNFTREVAVAAMLQERLGHAACVANDADIDGLFDASAGDAQAGQVTAVRHALGRKLFVLTGGPGTGKTTTVLRLLMAAAHRHHAQSSMWPRIALAAPTGKAAQRMRESLRSATPGHFPPYWHAALAQVQTQAGDAGTLHRLLESRGTRGGFARHADALVDADIVVVDEASMLDLAMLRVLLAALSPDAALVLVGDADQLDSVGTGSVLQDIVAALEGDESLQRLHHAYRADAALRPLNEAVRIGDVPAFEAALAEAPPASAIRHSLGNAGALDARLDDWCAQLLADYHAHRIQDAIDSSDATGIAARLAIAHRRQLLCALRETRFGATGLNAAIEARLSIALRIDSMRAGERWYPGRRILITRNDAASGLFNGDVGLCLLGQDGRMRVWFDGGDEPPRALEIGALPPHEPAFALTVHKAQGSEYEEVAVVPPPRVDHPLLSRQWFYTAISRARHRLQLWGDAATTAHAIQHPARRSSGLARRIRHRHRETKP